MARDGTGTAPLISSRTPTSGAGTRWFASAGLAALVSANASLPALADDLDVYQASIAAQGRPNVLFVLDYSGSMGWDLDGADAATSGKSARIDILKQAVQAVIDNNLDTANFGIGSIYQDQASGVRWPTVDMRDDARTLDKSIAPNSHTNRDVLLGQLERLPARGATATVNALAEASAYFRGQPVSAAQRDAPDTWDPSVGRHTGGNPLSVLPASLVGSGDRYASPVQSCQANAVILISDGQPTQRNDTARLRDAVGVPLSNCEDLSVSVFGGAGETPGTGNCGPEIAARMATLGNIPGQPNSVVNTYTIGFAIDGPGGQYLERIAQAGGGSAERADDLPSLTRALESFFPLIERSNQSFSGLSVNVDRASFAHEQRAYYNLFEPSRQNAWQGNLKGYFLASDGLKSLDGTAATVVKSGVEVFADTAQSFWSGIVDGDDVLLGGATEQLAASAADAAAIRTRADARTLYTYLGARLTGQAVALANNATHALSAANTALAAPELGLPSDAATRGALIDGLRAAPMGDPLHSQAIGLSYPGQRIVFTMTNQGLLHAFDTTLPVGDAATGSTDTGGGEELWAFMPKRLLANLPRLAANQRDGEHVYGLDGGITRWHDDDDGDGIVDPDERALLIFGMRRGGDSYYALDVSEPDSPKLVWEINAGVAGFERLGESWSRPALVNAASSAGTTGQERFLVFGGGYDAAALDAANAPTASRGNGVYVVDARGRLVWSVDGDDVTMMRHAMPSDPRLIDSDADGLADRLYIGDLGGQVWRVDFSDMRNAADYRVTRMASLAGGGHQPFFYPPAVAYHRVGTGDFLSISLGSGNRPDPMRRDSDNAFFMLRDTDVARGAPGATFSTIQASQLYDASSDALGDSDATVAAVARQALDDARGWRIDLKAGEKSLSAPTSFEGRLLATTFEPNDTVEPNQCAPIPIGRYYQMDILTGRALSADATAGRDPNARFSRLSSNGIPSTPLVVFPKGATQVSIAIDKQVVAQYAQGLSRVFWHAR